MNKPFAAAYREALDRTRAWLADFGTRFQPISMATSAETGALLSALLERLAPTRVIETGSGFSSAVLAGALHVENDAGYECRVREWLAHLGIDPGTFCGYDTFHASDIEGRFLMFLDGDLQTRERTAVWLQDKLDRAVVLIDDAQPGTFVQVQAVLDGLKTDPRGRLIDCAAWTRDGYGRSASLWVGEASAFPQELIEQLAAGPSGAAALPVRLLLCINDTPENARWECTVRSLTSIGITADLQQHPLWIVDNGSTCATTARFLRVWCGDQRSRGAEVRVFRLPQNRHATYAFNRLFAMVPAGDCVIRLENDIEFHTCGWPRRMARFLARSGFGLVCAKPVDLPTKALGVPTTEVAGMRVQVVDEVAGYCTAIAPELRLRLGALVCAGVYIEDVLTSRRAQALGYRMAFLDPQELRCYHVDRAPSEAYRRWKQGVVAAEHQAMAQALAAWGSGARAPYVPFAWSEDDGFHECRF
ncbi:hypothetical protein OOT46_26575 [Aquabacterium sp. A7-Y]|uniref:hypothetical protein n=1 Tax=Aquabacterium sp. A7-Y TaxID=1349605 RepID=UPI00223DA5FC|nr:hypothetical protein [Aquabacterium sp. A7-Y]MCW7541382.1 hypothetical protein [Aquabacterium sp. A7-Y]